MLPVNNKVDGAGSSSNVRIFLGGKKMESRSFFGAVFIVPHTFQCNSNLSVDAPVGI
jgi:hypothetical protein